MFPQIFVGKNDTDITLAIDEFKKAQKILDTNLYVIEPIDGATLKIDQIRELKKLLTIKAEAPRLIIIRKFETVKSETQNALLKTLEERTDMNRFIICTKSIGTVLETIISRSTVVFLGGDRKTESDPVVSGVLESIFFSSGSSPLVDPAFEVGSIDEAQALFDQIILFFHSQVLTGDVRAAALSKEAMELRSLVSTNNLNPQLTVDSWCITAQKMLS